MKVDSAARRFRPTACRYVALGDGFTEGVGDPDRRLPNGVRGWADRVAEGLAAAAPGWEYANLALRGCRLTALLGEQLRTALELEPTLVSVSVGSPDLRASSTKRVAMLHRYEFVVSVLAETGATVVLFTTAETATMDRSDDRTSLHNAAIRRIARAHGAVLVDPWDDSRFRARRMWDPDGVHPSRAGHIALADHVLEVLGVAPADDTSGEAKRAPGAGTGATLIRQVQDWVTAAAPPMSAPPVGQELRARWPIPVEVPARGGLRRLRWAGEPPPVPALPRDLAVQ